MNDLDLSRPATRQRTSNAARPGLRRIANTRTSNEPTVNPLQVTGTSRSQPHHKKNIPAPRATAVTPRHDHPRQLIPGEERISDRGPAPAPAASRPGSLNHHPPVVTSVITGVR